MTKFINPIEGDGKVDVIVLLQALLHEVGRLDSILTSVNKATSQRIASAETIDVRGDRDRIQQIYNRVYPVLFLPSKIPLEILVQIFIACLPHHPRPVIQSAPLLLCSVCTTWRQIALHTPALWTSITLRTVGKLSSVSRWWFSRAGDLPLTLRFEPSWWFRRPRNSTGPINLRHKVNNLELLDVAAGDTILRQLQNLLDVDNIHRISVKTASPFSTVVTPPYPFPQIRKLILSHKVEPSGGFVICPPPNLTHLCLSGRWLSADLWSSLIRECTSLQHGLFAIHKMHLLHPPGPVTTLKDLIGLKIVLYTDCRPSLLDNLYFPSLKSFSIGYVMETLGPWHPRYLAPVRVDKLRSLVLYRLTIPYKDLMNLLKMADSLESLVLDVPFRSSNLFKLMKVDGQSNSVLLPMISKLTIHHHPMIGGQFHTFDKYGFMTFVKSRWNLKHTPIGSPSSYGRISFVSVRTEHKDARIESLRILLEGMKRRGLRVSIGVSSQGYRVSTEVNW